MNAIIMRVKAYNMLSWNLTLDTICNVQKGSYCHKYIYIYFGNYSNKSQSSMIPEVTIAKLSIL